MHSWPQREARETGSHRSLATANDIIIFSFPLFSPLLLLRPSERASNPCRVLMKEETEFFISTINVR